MNHACAAQVLGRPLPRSIKRTATLALALSRVAWHHVAYSAPNVYGLLSVELLANGLVSERWLRRVAPCVEINHWFGGSPPNFRTLYRSRFG